MAIQNPSPPPASRPEPGSGDGDTFQLQLSSGNGPVYRTVLRTPPRDATPSEIPIIDISGIFSPLLSDRKQVAAQIHAAATNNGFFYIRNHGVPTGVTDAAHDACLSFFRQPQDVKCLADARQSAYFNGYKPPRTQRINPSESVDNRETFSWTYDPRCDPAVGPSLESVPPRVRAFLRIEPDADDGTVPNFAPSVITYWRSCLVLARALVRSFALSLDLDETFFDAKVTHPDAALALNYYPPLPPPTPPESPEHISASSPSPSPSPPPQAQKEQEQVSIGSHTDFQLFTILHQDNVPGLQVLSREGQWLNAPPVPGTFVVNIADYLQRITNDMYVSTVHRAINTSLSGQGRERVSMPFFFGFNMDESCAVLDSCVEASGGVSRYDEVSCYDWVQRRVKAMHDTKGTGTG
ncbi:2OG-Fe(II) oxygenase [Diaporthe sp. PMI_573]|nr:2OG-Fe(II) oxygenase [Diaporthaceae sp. PMI_573]